MAAKKIKEPTKAKLTVDVLKMIDPAQIVYAEFSDFGAMGACGTARIYVADEHGELIFYLTGDTYKDEEDKRCLYKAISYLDELKESKTLDFAHGGFGNCAFKNPNVDFTRNDDKCGFVYELKGKEYFISASVIGVYQHIVSSFAPRKVPIETLEEYQSNYNSNIQNEEESDFLAVYIEQTKRKESGVWWPDFSPLDYYNAVSYIKFINQQDFILNWKEISDSRKALQKYRLKYLVDKIGWNVLDDTIAKLVTDKDYNIFTKIHEISGEKVEKIYSKVETVEFNKIGSIASLDNRRYTFITWSHALSEKIFSCPRIVSFTKEEQEAINSNILKCPLNPNGRGIGKYLANCILTEDKNSYADILPVVARIIRDLPNDDFNQEHTDELFWLCGSIVDLCWRYIAEDDASQKQFRDFVYDLYWPRVGSFWPILHRDEFSFKEKSADKMFDDSVSFIMCLSDIDERNAEIGDYLKKNAANIHYSQESLGRRALHYCIKGLKPKEQFETIMSEVNEFDYHEWFSYPGTIKDAKILLEELFRTDKKARLKNVRMSVLESLIITANTKGVGEYILDYIVEHLDILEEMLKNDGYKKKERDLIFVDLFVAACMGVTEKEELAPISKWKEKLMSKRMDKKKLENAEKFAKKRQEIVAFQRKELGKLMEEGLFAK